MKRVLLAGAAGGTAEMLWIEAYASATPVSGLEIAREVTASVFPAAGVLALAPVIGITIHMILSFALAAAFVATAWHIRVLRESGPLMFISALAVLGLVWILNFHVVLPWLNPAFVALLPPVVTLASKLLFGAAMAAVICHGTDRVAR